MNRSEVAVAVGSRLVTQLGDAAMSAADTSGNLKEPIDDALRAMGYAEADLAAAEPEDARGFIAMTRYHALRAVWERIGDRFNVSTSGDSFALNQAFGNVEKLLKAAEADVVAIFGTLSPAGEGGGIITIDVNTLGWPAVCP